MNGKIAKLKEIGAHIKALLNETYETLNAFSERLDSKYTMDEVDPPARLEEIISTADLTSPVSLWRILDTMRLQIKYDSSMELNRLRKPLRDMEIAFNKLDLDQYLQPVEGEESLKDRVDDEHTAFVASLVAVLKRMQDQARAIKGQRLLFSKALDYANIDSKKRRANMDQEVFKVQQDPQMQVGRKNLEGRIKSILCEASNGRELHDEHLRMEFFQLVRCLLVPIVAKPAFDIFDRLDGCADYARSTAIE